MPNRSLKDINVIAADIVAQATGSENPTKRGRDPYAVALGRRGGAKGGKARAKKLTKQQRVEIARRAAKARWEGAEGRLVVALIEIKSLATEAFGREAKGWFHDRALKL